jgi:hypothetical protein
LTDTGREGIKPHAQQPQVPAVDLHQAEVDAVAGCDELSGSRDHTRTALNLARAVVVEDLGFQARLVLTDPNQHVRINRRSAL